MRQGPLKDLKVVEFEGLGPVPYAAMWLADMGADVVTLQRPHADMRGKKVSSRSRRVVELDLKSADGLAQAKALCLAADVVLEGFRPNVMERLGLGPAALLADNPRLVVGRMTGWGQTGPLADLAGHDINYIALTGALDAIGEKDRAPVPPLNLVGDFAGGSMFLIAGVLAALFERQSSGQGQIIDAAMVDGASHLMSMFWSLKAEGAWTEARGHNMLDGGAPYYGTYRCADGGYIAIGPIEPKFWAEFAQMIGLPVASAALREDPAHWPTLRLAIEALVIGQSRTHWAEVFVNSDACVSPVLSLSEAPLHPHMAAREVIVSVEGDLQPAPAPRFSRSAPRPPRAAETVAAGAVLADWV